MAGIGVVARAGRSGRSAGRQAPQAGHVVGEREPQQDRLDLGGAAHQQADQAAIAGLRVGAFGGGGPIHGSAEEAGRLLQVATDLLARAIEADEKELQLASAPRRDLFGDPVRADQERCRELQERIVRCRRQL